MFYAYVQLAWEMFFADRLSTSVPLN